MLKQPPRLVSITSCHFCWSMRFIVVSRVMPALLTSTSTGPRSASTWRTPSWQASIVGDVPFVGRDAGALGELARALVIAGVVRRDLHAHVLERDADRFANAARAAGDDRHSSHDSSPRSYRLRRLGRRQPACKFAARSAVPAWHAFGRIVEAFEQREIARRRRRGRSRGRGCRVPRAFRGNRRKSRARRSAMRLTPCPG